MTKYFTLDIITTATLTIASGLSGYICIENQNRKEVIEVSKVLDGSIIEVGRKEFTIQVPVVVGREIKAIEFENRRWPYLLSLPLTGMLVLWVFLKKKILGRNPKINTFWFDGLGSSCRQIKEGAASWKALDIIYNYSFGQKKGFGGIVDDFWIGMINAQAVRNRLRLLKKELSEAIKKIAQNEENEVRLLSLASGSAQAVIEVVAELKEINIKATLLDLDSTAIDYSRKLARKHGIEEEITFVVGNTFNLERANNGLRPHVIEMIGFLDYRPHAKAILLIKRIHEFLLPGGIFITGNVCPNPEQHFLKWIIDWSMIYRRPEEFARLLAEGGFSSDGCKIICEPLGLHAVAICRKLV